MELSIQKTEALIRLSTIVMLVLTACLIGLDSQTKVIFYVQKKASFNDLRALVNLAAILRISSLASLYFGSGSSVRSVCGKPSGNGAFIFGINRRRELPMAQVVQ
ncbi:CASP-like protein XL3 isoform X1 [Gossypium raimondii]|uniref:CASP-like protein XL3 isoform X1 n=1 Tax=Gossypium raimondii TaxID=29730 RepID=UPI00227B9672|nr:CASP-like protein XL3 isoform X1 [Gossypium raimondii]